MSKFSLLVLIVIFFSSCSVQTDDDGCNPEMTSARFEDNKKIVITENTENESFSFVISDGEKQVFQYIYVGAECDDIIDDETGENLLFEIDPGLDSFKFTDEELLSITAIYQPTGAWVSHNPHHIEEGTISGERLSGSRWQISVDVTVPPYFESQEPRTISFDQVFTQQ